MTTGDSSAVAVAIGKQLGVDDVRAELLPDQKLAAVRVLAATSRRVAVVADGINDAPALMAADVGIAMGSGTDIAQESAGILLLGDDLMVLVEMLRLARRCRGISCRISTERSSLIRWGYSLLRWGCSLHSGRPSSTSHRNWPSSSIPPDFCLVAEGVLPRTRRTALEPLCPPSSIRRDCFPKKPAAKPKQRTTGENEQRQL